MKNPSSFDIGTQRCDYASTCRKSVSQSTAVPVRNGWLRLLSAYSLIQMQSDAKVEKKCATSYLIDDMILKSILPFLPIISGTNEIKSFVINEN